MNHEIIENNPKGTIYNRLYSILHESNVYMVSFCAPYITSEIINLFKDSTINIIYAIIDKNAPDYTYEFIYDLIGNKSNFNAELYIIKRKKKTRFMHVKLMVVFKKINGKIIPYCAINGSFNFTKNGMINNEEIMNIFYDDKTITKIIMLMDRLSKESIKYKIDLKKTNRHRFQ